MKKASSRPAGTGWRSGLASGGIITAMLLGAAIARADDDVSKGDKLAMSPEAHIVTNANGAFAPDPHYGSTYEPTQQIEIYGGKHQVNEQRPIVEIGQPLYIEGPLTPFYNDVGRKNLVQPAFSIFGDWRSAVSYVNNGKNKEVGGIATRLNLETDLQLTSTERIHALFRPLDQNGVFTHEDLFGPNQNGGSIPLNLTPRTAFFEGDLGNIVAGFTDQYQGFDLPFAVGLTPLLFQNGVWVNSALLGGAVSIAGRNSSTFHISNMDTTFFAGFDNVTTPAIKDTAGRLVDHGIAAYGAATFIEATEGYWEGGIGYIQDNRGEAFDASYGDASIAFTRRYGGWLSNSMRVVYAFGQQAQALGQHTADGVIFLMENSLISPKELVLVPYMNLFYGTGHPQSLMRNADAGGILNNTGILYETDGLTGFPKLDDSGQDTYGGSIGLEYLFNLDQQIVLEFGTVQTRTGSVEIGRQARGAEYGGEIRYQRNITNSLLFRANLMYAEEVNLPHIAGIDFELRQKF
ncbi:MAG TPA: hypothetical protein VH206_18200 [Xanthobacteraceae bacterium]|jgi:hypothetical protein|nr:hypothetical protein [Xanthobacteraceae bacterium]